MSIAHRTQEGCKRIGLPRSTFLRYVKGGIIADAPRDGRGWRVFSEEYIMDTRQALKARKLI